MKGRAKRDAAREAVRLEVIRWMEHVRSELSALYTSVHELKQFVKDNPNGVIAEMLSLSNLYEISRGVEQADSAASSTALPPSRPLPDPIGVAARRGVK